MDHLIRISAIALALGVLSVACSSTSSTSTGSGAQKLSVGSACTSDSECGSMPFMCMQGDHPGGYCMSNCDITKGDSDCPSESVCQFDGMVGECHLKCTADTDCRKGYMCSPASSTAASKVSHAFCDVMGMPDGGATLMDSGH